MDIKLHTHCTQNYVFHYGKLNGKLYFLCSDLTSVSPVNVSYSVKDHIEQLKVNAICLYLKTAQYSLALVRSVSE